MTTFKDFVEKMIISSQGQELKYISWPILGGTIQAIYILEIVRLVIWDPSNFISDHKWGIKIHFLYHCKLI